jgi:cytochrome c-type biogenesis protein CcmH
MSPWRWLSWAGVAALVVGALVVGTRPAGPSGADDRGTAIAEGLRCPVCQGLSVADSDSETARSIRADITRRVDDGQSDAAIRQAYVDRYGEWILLRPRGRGLGTLVWSVPIVAVAAAGAGIAVVGHRRRRQWRRHVTEQDRRLVARARDDHLDGDEPAPGASRVAIDRQARRVTARPRSPSPGEGS